MTAQPSSDPACCENCVFFRGPAQFESEQTLIRHCHKNAPVVNPMGDQWPRVRKTDWCGDYNRKGEHYAVIKDPHRPVSEP